MRCGAVSRLVGGGILLERRKGDSSCQLPGFFRRTGLTTFGFYLVLCATPSHLLVEWGEACMMGVAIGEKGGAEVPIPDDMSFVARLSQGSHALQEGKLEAALHHLKAAVELNQNSAEAHLLLGFAYFEYGEYNKSIEQHKEAVRLSPGEERMHMALVGALIRLRAYSEAEQALKEVIQVIPDSGRAHHNLGELYFSRGQLKEALGEFLKAIELRADVGLDLAYSRIGDIHSNQVRVEEAIDAYKKALEINPNLLEVHGTLGDLYFRRRRYDDALVEYLAVLALDPQRPQAYAQMGQVHLRKGNYAQAVEAARKSLELDPQHYRAYYTLGNALIRLGRTEEGQKELQKFQHIQAQAQVQEHRQREIEALNREALPYLQSKEYEKAIALFRKVIEYDPQMGPSYFNLAVALSKAGKHEQAIKNFHKVLELNFDLPEAHRYLAEEYRLLGRLEESQKERAIYLRMKQAARKKREKND